MKDLIFGMASILFTNSMTFWFFAIIFRKEIDAILLRHTMIHLQLLWHHPSKTFYFPKKLDSCCNFTLVALTQPSLRASLRKYSKMILLYNLLIEISHVGSLDCKQFQQSPFCNQWSHFKMHFLRRIHFSYQYTSKWHMIESN